MRRGLVLLGGFAFVAAGITAAASGQLSAETAAEEHAYLVLYGDGISNAEGQAAISSAGGTVVGENSTIGLAEVRSNNPNFLEDVRAITTVKGAARDRSIGTTAPGMGHKFA